MGPLFMLMHRKRDERARRAMAAGLAFLALAFLCAGARADDSVPATTTDGATAAAPPDDGIVKNIAKKVGLATDPGEPQDFVVKARPAGAEDYIPVGRKEFVRGIKARTPAELKEIEADLEAVRARHDALRSTFAPAVKAVANAEAAKAVKADKSKKKPPQPASPQ